MVNKKIIKLTVLAISISLTISLILAELIYQTVFLASINYWEVFVPDEDVSWKLKPNNSFEVEWIPGVKQTITTNNEGLRDTPNASELNSSLPTVMLQGDSNILGYGIHSAELSSNLIKNNLDAMGLKINMINAGTSGYDLQHYVMQMKVLEKIYKPDYNFLIFNLNNDYFSSLLSTSYSYSRKFYDLKDDELVLHDREFRVQAQGYGLRFIPSLKKYQKSIIDPYWSMKKKPTIYGIWGQSYLAYGVYSRLIARPSFEKYFDNKNKKAFSQEELDYSYLKMIYFMYEPAWSEPYISAHRLIEKLIETYSQYESTKTIVVILPPRSEIIEKQMVINDIKKLSKDKWQPDFNVQYTMMINSLDKLKIPYINLHDDFLNASKNEILYFNNNEHINVIGHKLLADAIEKYILNEKEKTKSP